MIRVFKSKIIRQQLTAEELDNLVKDFRGYKAGYGLPSTFGRDVPYDHPDTFPIIRDNTVMHVHLAEPDTPWPLHTIQFKKRSNTHLVYCPGASMTDCYLLMAILSPPAHAKAWDRNVMYPLGQMAMLFRNQY